MVSCINSVGNEIPSGRTLIKATGSLTTLYVFIGKTCDGLVSKGFQARSPAMSAQF